jgi:hypothetical protein
MNRFPTIVVETFSQHPDARSIVKTLILAINHCADVFAECERESQLQFHVNASATIS